MKIYRNRWMRTARDTDQGGDGGAGGGGGSDDQGKPGDDGSADSGGSDKDNDGDAGDGDDKPLRPEGQRALERVKAELQKAKDRLKEIDDANLSKEDKLTRDNSELTTKLTAAETRVAQFEIALDKGLTKSQALRLVGNTREELEADAEELAKDLGIDTQKPADRLRKKPKENLRGGGAPLEDDGEMDPAKLAAAVKARNGGGMRVS